MKSRIEAETQYDHNYVSGMETELVEMSPGIIDCSALKHRVHIRNMTAEEWIEQHASGTLRKNKRIGFRWQAQYRHERVAYEFGWTFELLPTTYVTFNDPITEEDCSSITEAGWHIERYINMRVFPEDFFQAKYIQVDYGDHRREGVGLILRTTSARWVPKGHLVFAIVAEYSPIRKSWLPAQNPC